MRVDDPEYRDIVAAAYEWRGRITSGALTPDELQAFEAWLKEDIRHEEIYDQAETYWAAFDHFHADDVDEAFLRRSWPERLTHAIDQVTSLFAAARIRIAAVAVALALVAVSILMMQVWQAPAVPVPADPIVADYSAGVGETVSVTLSDGTIATLGARTVIETEYYPDKRILRLASGAALFEVAPDPARPFSVQSGALTATVLGTTFEVRSNGGITRVGVAEGRVRVTHPFMVDHKPTQLVTRRDLAAGEQIVATNARGLRRIQPVNPERVGAWRDQLLLYSGATLKEIVADANRYSDRRIILDVPEDIAAREINASFRTSDIAGMLATLPRLYPVIVDDHYGAVVRILPRQGRH